MRLGYCTEFAFLSLRAGAVFMPRPLSLSKSPLFTSRMVSRTQNSEQQEGKLWLIQIRHDCLDKALRFACNKISVSTQHLLSRSRILWPDGPNQDVRHQLVRSFRQMFGKNFGINNHLFS
jgi:hypothetical protein